jgi:predicted metal-binding membrane protein
MPRAWAPIALLILVPLVCWAWIAAMAHDMYGPMTGASAWMMTPVWDARYLLLLWAMWAVMMSGMMLPSAAPMILLTRAEQSSFLALGYLAVWAAFSVGAVALQWLLTRLLVLTPMMEVSTRKAGAVLLGVAGLYQWTPFKHACLSSCQAPMAFVTRRWRSGRSGAFRMGLEHGLSCVGCCWALMLVLFVGGVMNLTVIAALTVFVAFEKLVPVGAWGARASGAVLVAIAIWMAAASS